LVIGEFCSLLFNFSIYMKAMLKKRLGFTLIELLIVIGILGILVVAVLLTLNPAEAQRKARDADRMKDLGTLQAIVDQLVNSGTPIVGCLTSGAGCTTISAGVGSQPCAANFLGMDVCAYAQNVPLDPQNGQSRTFILGASSLTRAAVYGARVNGSSYEVAVFQESTANARNVTSDGGSGTNAAYAAEAGSDLTLL
jgi:prepilin-type N-terminal cleavage/methylation domain-containing protein